MGGYRSDDLLGRHPIDGPFTYGNEPDRPVRGLDDVAHTHGLGAFDLFDLAQRRAFQPGDIIEFERADKNVALPLRPELT